MTKTMVPQLPATAGDSLAVRGWRHVANVNQMAFHTR